MATNFSKYQNLVEEFNNKYGTDFRFEEFEMNVLRNQNLAENFLKAGGDINGRAYVSTFSNLYRMALTNYADRKIDSFYSKEFINDYKKVMNGYKDAVNQEKVTVDGWPKTSYLVERVQKDLENEKTAILDDKVENIIKRYNDGKLPMRKMREYAQTLIDADCKEPEKLSVILGYSKALEEINSKRPRWWRIIHPFRNNAEQRDAKFFKKMVTGRLGIFNTDARPLTSKTREQYIEDAKKAAAEANEPAPRIRPQDIQTRHEAKANARPLVGATQFSSTLTDDFLIARTILQDSSIADAKQELREIAEKIKMNEKATTAPKNDSAEKQNDTGKVRVNLTGEFAEQDNSKSSQKVEEISKDQKKLNI